MHLARKFLQMKDNLLAGLRQLRLEVASLLFQFREQMTLQYHAPAM